MKIFHVFFCLQYNYSLLSLRKNTDTIKIIINSKLDPIYDNQLQTVYKYHAQTAHIIFQRLIDEPFVHKAFPTSFQAFFAIKEFVAG
jgi:hypothetical protein